MPPPVSAIPPVSDATQGRYRTSAHEQTLCRRDTTLVAEDMLEGVKLTRGPFLRAPFPREKVFDVFFLLWVCSWPPANR